MTRWLVIGAAGQLGTDLVEILGEKHAADPVTAVDVDRLDITDRDAVRRFLPATRPDVVINCAAYTAVDAAEGDPETARLVNADGPAHIAGACADAGAKLLHVSTDYVFAGDATKPYGEDDPVDPKSVYGVTKAAGERAVLDSCPQAFVVRTAWLYGAEGSNFVKTIVRLSGERDTLDVVDDQRGSPTWSHDLAEGLLALAVADATPGIYHCTNDGETTWCGFARAIFEALGTDPQRVRPVSTDAAARPAPRPAYSVLSAAKWKAAGLPPMRSWQDAFADAWPLLAAGTPT